MLSTFNLKSTPMPMRLRGSRRAQSGMSLMELMVGLTIGLLVVVAAIGNLAFTQITSSVVGDNSRLQQKADAVFRNIGFHVTQAGALQLESMANSQVKFSSAYTGFNPSTTGASGGQIFSVHGLEGASGAADTLRVSYQDDGAVRDCLGNRPATAQVNVRVDNQFSVSGTDLMCLGANSSSSAQSIADGVEDFQVLYGVLLSTGNYQYFTADQVTDWTNIQSVSVCLQLQGDSNGNPQTGLSLNGCNGSAVSSTDGKLHRVFQRTFGLRNYLL